MLEIVLRFAEHGYQIAPDALDLIASYPGPRDDLIRRLLSSLDGSIAVVRAEDVLALNPPAERPRQSPEGNLVKGPALPGPSPQPVPVADPDGSSVEVVCDITGRSTCVGDYEDFIRYFRDRYGKIREMLSRRLNSRPIESLSKSTSGREVSLIGMVMEVRTTAKGNRVIELEDPTGMVTAVVQKESTCFDQSQGIVTDEVIGVTGMYDGSGRIFVKSLVWPDLPNQSQPLAAGAGGALLTSDIHVGSKYFMADAWERFLSWVNGESDDPSGLASRVKYLVIAGDLVDGIGIYPGQEGDLAIKDIYDQYEEAARCLNGIRPGITVVISPGNHDIVRQAEPQPALPEEIQKMFSGDKVFVGSPAWITLGGVSLLVYHGRSIDDLVLRVPGLSYGEPEKAMMEMLRRRHLCPIYGNRVSIAPEQEDHYVIKRTPAVLHCGHVHTIGIARYKGVAVVNSGTWQSQTDFQKKMNIQPTPAIVPHIDLATMKIRKLLFA
ncbi:MAG TPA: DNA-directed DNA polymerase II small subunit [Methanotrichaceae archaeon]|nr:DNA-directed DNA polymerase II small subunit [Methanotrichaceae archaeon]